jgi:hypothetical protein
MNVTLNEEQYKELFLTYYEKYAGICETLFTKSLDRANDRTFARAYFLQQIESELEFHKGFKFNGTVLSYFQLFYNLGFSWNKFLKEVRILQKIHNYYEDTADIIGHATLHSEFSPQEIKRIEVEAEILRGSKNDNCIYNYLRSVLLTKSRDIDFINYVAKYKSISDFVQTNRNEDEFNDVNNPKIIYASNENIRWNGGKGKKIELIRLLVALNDCKYFETKEGTVPNQEQLMNYFGEMLSINLKHYEQDLSNGFESKLQTNIAVFEKLKLSIEKRYHQKVEQN